MLCQLAVLFGVVHGRFVPVPSLCTPPTTVVLRIFFPGTRPSPREAPLSDQTSELLLFISVSTFDLNVFNPQVLEFCIVGF